MRQHGLLWREGGAKGRKGSSYTSSLVSTLQGGGETDAREQWTDNLKYGCNGLEDDKSYTGEEGYNVRSRMRNENRRGVREERVVR